MFDTVPTAGVCSAENHHHNGSKARQKTCAHIATHRFLISARSKRQGQYMNRDRLEGMWKQLSGSVRERWGRLTGDRLSVVAGQHNQRAGKCQEQYGVDKDESKRALKEFLRRNRAWDSSRR